MDITLTLPYPPTGNHSAQHTRNGHYSTQSVRRYRNTVATLIAQYGASMQADGGLAVEADIYPPDQRKRDLDNAWKTLADALTQAGVWRDDAQIGRLSLTRCAVVKDGAVVVRVRGL